MDAAPGPPESTDHLTVRSGQELCGALMVEVGNQVGTIPCQER